jgi:hypothetical protein
MFIASKITYDEMKSKKTEAIHISVCHVIILILYYYISFLLLLIIFTWLFGCYIGGVIVSVCISSVVNPGAAHRRLCN